MLAHESTTHVNTSDDVHVLTVYVDADQVRIVAILNGLRWLPNEWRERVRHLIQDAVGELDVSVREHAAGLAIIVTGTDSVSYWTSHARELVDAYVEPLVPLGELTGLRGQ